MSRKTTRYRDFDIEPYINCPGWEWIYAHKDYDGPEDNRVGTASSFDKAMTAVDDWWSDREEEEIGQ